MTKLKASFIIPAYNEERHIAATVAEIQEMVVANHIPYEIVIVNDNSVDDTPGEILRLQEQDPCIKAVHRTLPAGFGRALRAGLQHVEGDLVIIYMADQSDDPLDALAYYRKIEEGYDCVFGSRFRKCSRVEKYPWKKLVVNRAVNRIIQLMFWCPFNDLTNAFKAYRTHVLRDCGPFRASHFNITIEMSLSALIRKYNIAEIPISWRGRTWGSSNLRMTEMGRRYLEVLLTVFFERMLVSDDILQERLASQARTAERAARIESRLERLEKRVERIEDTTT